MIQNFAKITNMKSDLAALPAILSYVLRLELRVRARDAKFNRTKIQTHF